MALTAMATADSPGLSEGTAYPVLGFTGSTVLILDDDNKLQHISYAALENEKLWSLGDDANKAPAKRFKPKEVDTSEGYVPGQVIPEKVSP